MKVVRGSLACLALAHFSAVAVAQDVHAKQLMLSIEAQPMVDALNEWSQQTGLQIIVPQEVISPLIARELKGSYTAQTSLSYLFAGTGLTYEFVNARTVVVREQPRPSLKMAAMQVDAPPAPEVKRERSELPRNQQDLEVVIVTAQKRGDERVQDVPMSIAVITGKDIDRRGLIGMEDYLRAIPGVNQIDVGAGGGAIVIRGIATSPQFENLDSGATVATYLGETPITGIGGPLRSGVDVRPVDIERIEVLRGPQGTAYGSASLGGTMRYIPALPNLNEFSTKVAASYSETSGTGGDNSMMQGVVNVPVIAGELALRAVGYRYDESGFYKNVAGFDPVTMGVAERFGVADYVRGFTQNDAGRMLSTGGRLAALWQATDDLRVSLTYVGQTIEQDGAPSATLGKYEHAFIPVDPRGRERGEVGPISDAKMDLFSAVIDYDLGWGDVTSAFSWIDANNVSNTTAVDPFPYSTTYRPMDFKTFTSETRVISQLDGRFQFLAGFFYEDVEDGYLQTVYWPGAPLPSPVVTDPMLRSGVQRDLRQRAIFGELSYELTGQLTATVGGRFFDYKKDLTTLLEGGFANVPLGAGVPTRLGGDESDSSFKANLTYKPSEDSMAYVSWSEGFRLGRPTAGVPAFTCDPNNDGVVDGTNITLESTRTIKSDFLESYELGGKLALFERRMTIEASVYHIKWDGLPILSTIVCANAPRTYTANLGSAESNGMELQASLLVVNGLRLDMGVGYTKAELAGDAPALGARKGARLPGSPEYNANLALEYDFELAGHRAFVRADTFYTGDFYGSLTVTPGSQPAGDYFKADARAGISIRDLSVELFVRNLTNEDAFTWRGLTTPTEPYPGYLLRPRTVGVQLGYSFGR